MATIEQVTDDRCTGCFGCFNVCPEDAISMTLSSEGFYRPVVDKNRCTDCGRCITHCPELSWQAPLQHPPAVFAAWTTDDNVRMDSSSGGVFSELARATLNRGGAVVACAWNSQWDVEHIVVESWNDVPRLRGSKYIPSRMGKVISQILGLARQGREVLFCGTPCQVAAVSLALPNKLRHKVLLADLICHGVPSLKVFHQYREKTFPDGLDRYQFRAKTKGWNCASIEAITKTQLRFSVRVTGDVFQQAFQVHHLILMKSCHDCRFQGGPRPGDITLGDFWRVPERWNDQRGVSVILANSDAGRERITALVDSSYLQVGESTFPAAAAGNPRLLSGLRPIPPLRSVFMGLIAQGVSFMKLARLFLPPLRISQAVHLANTPEGRKLLLKKAWEKNPLNKAISRIRVPR